MTRFFSTIKQLLNHPLVRLSIAVALLYVVFRQVNLEQIWFHLQQAKPIGLVIFFCGSLFLAWLAGWRWALILVPRKITVADHWAFFRVTMLGLFYNLFMPSNVGGDALKWTGLTHLEVPRKVVILTMVIDRALGLLGLITVGFITLVLSELFNVTQMPALYFWVLGAGFAGVILFLILISTDWKWRQLPFLGKWGWVAEVENYLELHRKRFWAAFGVGVLVQVISAVIEYSLAWSVGFNLTWFEFLIIWPILGAVIALPINFAGFGATEVGFVYFFAQFGEEAPKVLALTALMAVFRFVLGGLGWVIGLTEIKQKS
jgi:uncharacterized membrane protein YbhN (UPF0104 family)